MSLNTEKKYAIKVAKELHYPEDVITKLKKAKNDFDISRILMDARNKGVTV